MFQNLLLLGLAAIFSTVSFEELVDLQNQGFVFFPFIFLPLFILGFIALLLENFRAPFDMSEAEGEIITGYTIEYYGWLFFAFLFCEFLNVWNGCIIFIQVFFSAGSFKFLIFFYFFL